MRSGDFCKTIKVIHPGRIGYIDDAKMVDFNMAEECFRSTMEVQNGGAPNQQILCGFEDQPA